VRREALAKPIVGEQALERPRQAGHVVYRHLRAPGDKQANPEHQRPPARISAEREVSGEAHKPPLWGTSGPVPNCETWAQRHVAAADASWTIGRMASTIRCTVICQVNNRSARTRPARPMRAAS